MAAAANKSEEKRQESELAKLLSLLGLLASAGAAVAGATFVIGYLAVKRHDALLGWAGTTSPGSYIRTGIEFVPKAVDSVMQRFGPEAAALDVQLWIAAGLLMLVIGTLAYVFAPCVRSSFWWVSGIVIIALHAALFAWLLAYLPQFMAPTQPQLSNLLFSLSGPSLSPDSHAWKVYEALRAREGEAQLRSLFGESLAILSLGVAALLLLRRWRRSLTASTDKQAAGDVEDGSSSITSTGRRAVGSYILAVNDWLARPLAWVVVGIMIVHLPAVYGVLGVSNRMPCARVALEGKKELEPPGYLISDLSVEDVRSVIIYRAREPVGYEIEFWPLDTVRSLVGARCPRPSLIPPRPAEEVANPPSATTQSRDETPQNGDNRDTKIP